MHKFILLFFFALLVSCTVTVNPNEWVVSTGTCWNSMTVSKAGDYVPKTYTTCDRVIVLPATELAAEFSTETKFQARVAGEVSLSYRWRITNPIKFISAAKSITSASTDSDHKVDPNALEEIENGVVDKILIDLIREYTPSKEAGTDELRIEQDLQKLVEPYNNDRGIEFSNMSINVTFSRQTEEALDVISALKFYEANGQLELGKIVIANKAGASNVNLSVEK